MRQPIPDATRAAVKKRSGGRCEDCGSIATDLHHLRYVLQDLADPCGVPIFGLEQPDDLAHLCRECHYKRHRDMNGDYWRDPEEMAAHWQGYHDEMERG